MKYKGVHYEDEIKGKVGRDWFSKYDYTRKLGDIDFCVSPLKQVNSKDPQSFLWAEAKTKDFDYIAMYAQLIMTIGQERTFDKYLPPTFLCVFDAKKIVFVPYNEISDIFYLNDFNWTSKASNHSTKEFLFIKKRIESILNKNTFEFDFLDDEKELKVFIKNNISIANDDVKILIDKNNFVPIYLRWLSQVKPLINFDWKAAKKQGFEDCEFFLADLFVDDKGTVSIDDDTSIKDELFVVFKNKHYQIEKKNLKSLFNAIIEIKDIEKYENFWKKYRRSPLPEFHQYIIDRRDLLIPQDVRQRKGSFFTPQIWVDLSQKYIAEVLGEYWQDDYYIWDCAAGTGNLLVGLTNKENIWASTIDMADVNVMMERISNGANLQKNHVFQFDFLNDDFSKLPKSLFNIIKDPEKRKKLIIYINPPYAEASDMSTLKKKVGKGGVEQTLINKQYAKLLGQGNAELFAQFFIRINQEIKGSILAEFSTLKILQGQHFIDFRNNFHAKLKKTFIVPSYTFDNVKGKFPIGFMIWTSSKKEMFKSIVADVYDENGEFLQKKTLRALQDENYINEWIKPFRAEKTDKNVIGKFPFKGNDFQNSNMVSIVHPKMMYNKEAGQFLINANNLIKACVYFAVRKCIKATWLNDRDQFLAPLSDWELDVEFQNDCFTYSVFSNNIQTQYGINHWIPFTEDEVNAKDDFESNFMSDFISGKIKLTKQADLFNTKKTIKSKPLTFSKEAKTVFKNGQALWKYYHKQYDININASLYDIRLYFQGTDEKGKMNLKSDDDHYMELITNLRSSIKVLADKIAPKVYTYGFLKD
jgi:hypothetical protein